MAKPKSPVGADGTIPIAENRKARFEYEISDTIECGLSLHGAEVKSLRHKAVSFADSFAVVERGQLWLMHLKIDRYKQSNIDVVEPTRRRRLLANQTEIEKLERLVREKGLTLVPLRLYFRGPWAKVLLGVGKGKSHGDKRETIKRREADREVSRALRDR
jgi:SsrA-binding protein